MIKEEEDQETYILVVDDEPRVINVIRKGLKSFGYYIQSARNIKEAKQKLENRTFDLMICDIKFPQGDGISLLKYAKTHYPDIGVIMLTGVYDAGTAIECMRAGASNYLTKPYEILSLVMSVKESLEKRKLVLEKKKQQEYLRKLVKERTAELTTINKKLRHEIIEHKEAEDELKKSENKFRALFQNMTEGVVLHELIYNEDGIPIDYMIIDANPAFEYHAGISPQNVIGKKASELYGSGRPPYLDVYKKVAISGQPAFFETYLEQMKRYFSISVCSPIKGQFATVFENITERKQAEKEIKELNLELEKRVSERTAELEAANKELKHFAYVTSHDLKAPLRAISQLADFLIQDYADVLDKEGKKLANMLIGRAKRMHNLIDGILEYSRVGRIKAEKEKVVLGAYIKEIIDIISPPDNVHIYIENDLPTIFCEKLRIGQVFQNLLDNAVKFMDKPDGTIRIECFDENTHYRFAVSDTGPGIEKKYFERIFQIFQTLTPRDERECTGIGLSIVKKIVELFEGEIWVESQTGKGSTFFFTLPKQSALMYCI